MASPESIQALKKSGKHKTTIRLEGVFDYVKRWIEAPLVIGKIVYRGRRSYVEVKCTRHDRIMKVKNIKQLMKEDLVLCKACSKERYSKSMMVKMQEYHVKMTDKYTVKKFTFKNNITITPEMLEAEKKRYFDKGGVVDKIG